MSATNDTPGRPRRTPFVAVVVGLLAIGLIGQLLLNTALQRGSFTLHDMQIASADLETQQQSLQQELARRESPASLATDASRLGMVASGAPVFLQLADGSVQGTPSPAPTPTPTPTSTGPTTPATEAGDPTTGQATDATSGAAETGTTPPDAGEVTSAPTATEPTTTPTGD